MKDVCKDCFELNLADDNTTSTWMCDMCHVDVLEQEEKEREEWFWGKEMMEANTTCDCGDSKEKKKDMCSNCLNLFDEMIKEFGA